MWVAVAVLAAGALLALALPKGTKRVPSGEGPAEAVTRARVGQAAVEAA
jgi:hypothetical protein